nr:hypothetical protein [Haladaptatus salinisoli]
MIYDEHLRSFPLSAAVSEALALADLVKLSGHSERVLVTVFFPALSKRGKHPPRYTTSETPTVEVAHLKTTSCYSPLLKRDCRDGNPAITGDLDAIGVVAKRDAPNAITNLTTDPGPEEGIFERVDVHALVQNRVFHLGWIDTFGRGNRADDRCAKAVFTSDFL